MNILHTYIDNMYIDRTDETKHSFAQKWGLVSLAKSGHNVTLLCGSRTKKREEFVWNNIQIIQLPGIFQITNSTRFLKGFNKELKTIKPDIIHTHHYASFIPEISLIHAKLNRIPIILTIHNSFTEGSLFSKLFAFCYLIIMQIFLPFYDHTTFISKYLQNKWRFILTKSKSSVVYNQISKPKNSSQKVTRIIHKNSQNILYIGRLSHQKGVDLLIKSIKQVKEQIPNIKLQIIGQGSSKYTLKLKKICKKYKLNNSIEFLGYKSGKEKASICAKNDIMIVPSRDEGFGNVVIEAFLDRIHLIISNNGSLPEAANGFAKIFQNNSPTNLAKEIINAINLKNSKEQLKNVEDAYTYANKFTSEKIANELENIYTSFL